MGTWNDETLTPENKKKMLMTLEILYAPLSN